LTQPSPEVIAIAGNHDFALEDAPDQGVHRALLGARWTYLQDAGVTTASGLNVWGTSWAPWFGDLPFVGDRDRLARQFERIPAGLDILIVHGPSYGFGDRALPFGLPVAPSGRDRDNPGQHVGSPELTAAIERAQPRLAV
jgi:Icc-related predicted phosphoesterase